MSTRGPAAASNAPGGIVRAVPRRFSPITLLTFGLIAGALPGVALACPACATRSGGDGVTALLVAGLMLVPLGAAAIVGWVLARDATRRDAP